MDFSSPLKIIVYLKHVLNTRLIIGCSDSSCSIELIVFRMIFSSTAGVSDEEGQLPECWPGGV